MGDYRKRLRRARGRIAMRILPILCILALLGCSTTPDTREPVPERPRQAPRRVVSDFGPLLLDMVPDDSWWRDPRMAEPLNLSNEQLAALDKIEAEQRPEIEKLQRDLRTAMRDYRNALMTDPPVQSDLTTAAQRVRDIRSAMFDRQAQMLAAERLLLTNRQWVALLGQMEEARRDRRWDERTPGGRRAPRVYPRGRGGRRWPY
jgi:Spy/CpxP family protein refolding chaperone